MAQNEISDYNETDASNVDITGIDVQENVMRPPAVNNAFRALQGALKRWFKSSLFRLRDSTDQTKLLAFGLSGISTATTRTLTVPDRSGTIALYSDLALKGHIYGLTLSNNSTDATNDIDIAAGEAASTETSPVLMVLASALTKRLDAVWAVGTNNGMLASGAAIANTTYHIFLIRRPDTGVVDIAADTSATGANIAANTNAAYTQLRRIGSILRESGAIVQFLQNGDNFTRSTAVDYSNSAARAAADLTISVPTGVTVSPILQFNLINSTAGVKFQRVRVVGALAIISYVNAASTASYNNVIAEPTSTATLRDFEVNIAGGALSQSQVVTFGWVDTRGQ